MIELFLARYAYLLVLVLLAVGLWGMLVKGDLVKKIIGMTVFQTAIFLFFIEGSLKRGAVVPIIDDEIGSDASAYVDPIPHLLILTAIVVGVAVLGVALALVVRIHRVHGSLDEEVVAADLAGRPRPAHAPPRPGEQAAPGGADDTAEGR